MEELFASAATFMACGGGDFLAPFKQYFTGLMDRMTTTGIEMYEVPEDSRDCLRLNVTYCEFYEVSKKLGDPYLCYITSCRGDEVFFERLCREAGSGYRERVPWPPAGAFVTTASREKERPVSRLRLLELYSSILSDP